MAKNAANSLEGKAEGYLQRIKNLDLRPSSLIENEKSRADQADLEKVGRGTAAH